MKFAICLVLFVGSLTLFGAPAQGQNVPSRMATVHVYRNGSHGNAIQILVDDKEVFKLGDDETITFVLTPGRHEIGARYAHQEPTVAIDAEAAQDYFVQLSMNAHRSALLGAVDPSRAGTVTVTRESGVLNGSQLHERRLSEDELSYILYATIQAQPMQLGPAPSRPPITTVPAALTAPTQQPVTTAKIDQPVQRPPETRAESFASTQRAYRVKYAGGSLPDAQAGKQLQLRISPRAIELGAENIPSASVTGITLSQDKHHRIGTGIAISMVTLGAGIPVMFSKSTKDFIEITWNAAGNTGGAAFQADKNEYRGILAALEGVTGKTAMLPPGQ